MSEKLEKYWQIPLILIAIILGLYLRVANPWNSVFVPWMEGARLSGNDPWYYFRLIDSAIHNFPNRLWFDALTKYPYGTYLHFGPFLVYLGAIISMLFGANTPEQIRSVIAFIPAVGGSLLAIPTYILTKEIFGKKAGVIASFLVVLIPGQLMARSVLSFNDHHIWEVFWQTSTLGTFILAYNRWKGNELRRNLEEKRQLMYPVFSGLCLGFYLLAWAPGFISALLILSFVVIIYLLRAFFKIPTDNLVFVSSLTFIIASIIYLPFAFKSAGFSTTRYTPFQLLVLLGSAFLVVVYYIFERFVLKHLAERYGIKEGYLLPALISLVSIVVIGIILVISPDFARNVEGIFRVVQPKGGALTVAEVQPFFTLGGKFSLTPAWHNFSITFFFAIPAMLYYTYRMIKGRDEKLLFILIWGFAMLIALAGQNRFAYYFGTVSAIFASAIASEILEKIKFYDYINATIKNDRRRMKKIGTKSLIAGALLLFILIYPTFSQANAYSKYSAGGINKQWYDALVWMRDNTPGREMYDEFYYQLYKPPEDPKERYPYYPDGVYSIISWWDYGHWITAIAHRIPVANPFQQGIGNKYNNVPGAAPFFTAFNESYANKIADFFDVKYVVSDVEMATGKFYAMAVWAEGSLDKAGRIYYAGSGVVYMDPTGKLGISLTGRLPIGAKRLTGIPIPSIHYYQTMEARFHIFDGSGLQHYRMVYESGSSRNTYSGLQEMLYRNIYNSVYAKKLGFGSVDAISTGYVKIFEYVKGVVVRGKANSSEVIAKVKIKTNQGRIFNYIQKVEVVDGHYELVLPYAQNTEYPVKPVSDYTIQSGKISKTLRVSEKQVENGDVITLDLT